MPFQIDLEYSRKPVPSQFADWEATNDDFEGIAGLGPTPEDAAEDLIEKLEAEGLI